MIKKHREQRTSIKADRAKAHHKEKIVDKCETPHHGLKRCGSESWQGDGHKVSKHKHQAITQNECGEMCEPSYKHQNYSPHISDNRHNSMVPDFSF